MEGITAPPASPVEPNPSMSAKSDQATVEKPQGQAQEEQPQVPAASSAQPALSTEMKEKDPKQGQVQSQPSEPKAADDGVKYTEPERASGGPGEASDEPKNPSEECQTSSAPKHNSPLESAEMKHAAGHQEEHSAIPQEKLADEPKETPPSEAKHVGKTEPSEKLHPNDVPQSSSAEPELQKSDETNDVDKHPLLSASSPDTHSKTESVKHIGTTLPSSERPETARAENILPPSTDQPASAQEQPSNQNKSGADAQQPHANPMAADDPVEIDTEPYIKENPSDRHANNKRDASSVSEEKELQAKPSEPAPLHEKDTTESLSRAKSVKSEIPNGTSSPDGEPGGGSHAGVIEQKMSPSAFVDTSPSIAKPGDASMEATEQNGADNKLDSEIKPQLEPGNESGDKKDSKTDAQNARRELDPEAESKYAGIKSKEGEMLTEQNVSVMDIDDTSVPGTKGAKTPITPSIKPGAAEMQNANEKTTPMTKPSETASVSREDVVMTEISPAKPDTGKKTKPSALEENSASGKKSRKTARKGSQSRLSRARSSSRGGAGDSSFDSGGKQDSAAPSSSYLHPQKSTEGSPAAPKNIEVVDDGGPRPVMEAKGLVMRVGNAVFVTENQLDDLKTARLNDKKVLPFEKLTFKELRTYNRDQLRAYCFAYGMERRKKTEMEADMARYLSYWNRGKPGFAIHEYIPTSGRAFDRDDFLTSRGSHANQSSASLGGSTYGGVDSSRRYGSRPQSGSGLLQDKHNASGGLGPGNPQTSPPAPSAGNANRNSRAGGTPASLQRGFGTSFKQRVHARQASAKFKAAYNGAGDTIVNVVENAAAYFEGKDSSEVIADQTKSFERYQLNVDLLTEIFDGPIQSDADLPKGHVAHANGNIEGSLGRMGRRSSATKPNITGKSDVMYDIAKRLLSNKRDAHKAELDSFESNLKRVEEEAKHTERRNMKLFQKLERAETQEQVESIKKEFEKEFGTSMDCTSRPVVRRKIDKTLPPLVIPDEQSRILRFTFL